VDDTRRFLGLAICTLMGGDLALGLGRKIVTVGNFASRFSK